MYKIKSLIFCSKDARLPVQLQRAMAAEAEAAREARAKVNIRLHLHVKFTVHFLETYMIILNR